MKKSVLATFVMLGCTAPAYASNWYVLGAVSQSQVNLDSSSLDTVLSDNGATSLSSSDSGTNNQWRLQAGYQVNPNLALEAGYIDLGKSTYKATFSGGKTTADWTSGGVDVAAVGILPINTNFSLLGKLGAIAAKTTTDWTSNGISGVPAGKENKSQISPFAGVGVSYSLNARSDLRMEYERFNGIGDSSTTGKADVSILSLGVTYHF